MVPCMARRLRFSFDGGKTLLCIEADLGRLKRKDGTRSASLGLTAQVQAAADLVGKSLITFLGKSRRESEP